MINLGHYLKNYLPAFSCRYTKYCKWNLSRNELLHRKVLIRYTENGPHIMSEMRTNIMSIHGCHIAHTGKTNLAAVGRLVISCGFVDVLKRWMKYS